ncbi:DUF1692-domain-containing protein [Ascobolus immersus RN42]|uniref:Endoplasmic reticulum-Golgi intermediate compartment protein n=1 Tax=Ascobolus immersus RN42 TaxID=1160509 RepID=A0A3N4HVT5_ASCIM|nr:DUF1692-domain-containing protein [Ascobolus immersus RN42]
MGRTSRLTRFDAFTKTVEDARIRTTSGGIVTITSVLLILLLIFNEWRDFRRIIIRPELVVDKSRAQKLEIHLNMTFPHMPCELLTLDVMDVSGDLQPGVEHGIHKTRLDPVGNPIETKLSNLHAKDLEASHLAKDYCGSCYGVPPPPNAQKNGCCQTCDEVREAYAIHGWAFGRGEKVEQCEREHYAEKLDAQRHEGCNIAGGLHVNKVVGNFHIAPGKSLTDMNMHMHDLNQYNLPDAKHDFTHIIHQLSFGPKLPDVISATTSGVRRKEDYLPSHNPLDNLHQSTTDKTMNFMYFIKIVSTSYIPLGVTVPQNPTAAEMHDLRYNKGVIETHQYSVTSHTRSVMGGEDPLEKGTVHMRGGIPGVFFSYDISPMKVVNREVRTKGWGGFLVGVCAVVGGTLTVAAAVDRGVYEGRKKLHKA